MLPVEGWQAMDLQPPVWLQDRGSNLLVVVTAGLGDCGALGGRESWAGAASRGSKGISDL